MDKKTFKPYDKVIIPFNGYWEPAFYAYRSSLNNMSYIMYYGGYEDSKILPYEGNEELAGKEYKP